MTPVPLAREVSVPFEASVFWQIVAGAAVASFLAVVLLAWHVTARPTRVELVKVPGECSAR
jgi:hypothetical protein